MLTVMLSPLDSIVEGTTTNDDNSTVVLRPFYGRLYGRLVRFAYHDLLSMASMACTHRVRTPVSKDTGKSSHIAMNVHYPDRALAELV